MIKNKINEQNKISFIKAIANEQDTNIHYKEKEIIISY